MLLPYYHKDTTEAGCDEAGRGPIAGPVYAAAVVLPPDLPDLGLNDSKKLTPQARYRLRVVIEEVALSWGVGTVSNEEIDRTNILQAAITAMHRALDNLTLRPEAIIVDGNRFRPYHDVPYTTVVKGDAKYQSIAAASILAKTYRDDFMCRLHERFPHYHWDANKGYPTPDHREAVRRYGPSPYHRLSFALLGHERQLRLDF